MKDDSVDLQASQFCPLRLRRLQELSLVMVHCINLHLCLLCTIGQLSLVIIFCSNKLGQIVNRRWIAP